MITISRSYADNAAARRFSSKHILRKKQLDYNADSRYYMEYGNDHPLRSKLRLLSTGAP